jgi:hypothetical protein
MKRKKVRQQRCKKAKIGNITKPEGRDITNFSVMSDIKYEKNATGKGFYGTFYVKSSLRPSRARQ